MLDKYHQKAYNQNTKRTLSPYPCGQTLITYSKGEPKHGHTAPGWQENHMVEAAIEEAMLEAMARGAKNFQPAVTTMMVMNKLPTRQMNF